MFWQNFLKKYIYENQSALISRKNSPSEALALPVLRMKAALKKPLVIALPEAHTADKLFSDTLFWQQELDFEHRVIVIPEGGRGKLLFPEWECSRSRALDLSLSGDFDIAIGSVNALFGPAPAPDETGNSRITLRRGMHIKPSDLLAKLVTLDYDDEYEASVPGEFARHGGIIDIYSPAHDAPCRVEFFGDEIDSLRLFSPETQRSTGETESYDVIGRSGITAGGSASSCAMDYFEKYEHHFLLIHPVACMDCLEKFIGDEAKDKLSKTIKTKTDSLSLYLDTAESGDSTFPDADIFPRTVPQIITDPAIREKEENLRFHAMSNDMQSFLAGGGHCLIASRKKEDCGAVEKWCKKNLPVNSDTGYHPLDISCGFQIKNQLNIITGAELVAAGFRYDNSLSATQHQNAVSVPAPAEKAVPDIHLADLDIGDYAVHLEYGIGIFRGLKTVTSNGIVKEMIAIEYKDGQILNIPLLQADKVSRYLGSAGKVKLNSLTGMRWKKEKENVRSGVRSYAADMLRMQALRQTLPGIAFPPDDGATEVFLRAFPYSDTDDQARVTGEIRQDMQQSRPMDRLLCGDVGYGKTEIAMRAAFRAVNAGYQVAVLAPTTVLVHQHLQSFTERFAEHPFNIAVLSRFESPVEQRKTVSDLASGKIDIVIGTHRLASEKIKFKNLGLVVIDEEQRFGVEHKERLRRFRTEADVLTMSATPIPRTLYLAMAGARDLSTLMTAPKERLPVKTVVAPMENSLIASAVKSELARGGQVYYLHNRVKTIDDCAAKLKLLIPSARIATAHGQMPEETLEKTMHDFAAGKIDCLVCSTIIESGLDVPNANTIIIENADRFGLSQLYQLRGRVGRYKHQAYAYMLLPRNQLISSDARRRLNAIRRCTKLGSGIQLALQDLEIRGAGNLLGAEQSGHINAIGFDLYCKLLKQEINSLNGKKEEFLPDVDVNIDFVAFALKARPGELLAAIPPEYIGGERLRIDAYRQLAGKKTPAEIDDFAEELRDRFGALPVCVKNLLDVYKLKILASKANYTIFSVVDGRVILRNPGGTIYRDRTGHAPVLDYRDPPELRMRHLAHIIERIDR